jgi:hypothetical protein
MQNNAFPQDNFACEQVRVLEAVNCRDPCLAIELLRQIMREAAMVGRPSGRHRGFQHVPA